MIQHYVLYRNATPQVISLSIIISTLRTLAQSKTPSDYESIDDDLPSSNSQAVLVEHEQRQAEDEVHVSVEEEPATRA